MPNEWDDIFSPSTELAQSLVETQFPQHCSEPLQKLGEGWDCVAFKTGDWVFRFPRRPLGVETLTNESLVLPQLGRSVLQGQASETFPYLFLGTLYQHGVPLEEYVGPRVAVAEELGDWLRTLHQSSKPSGLQPDPMGKLELAKRTDHVRRLYGQLPSWAPTQALQSPRRVVAHGDLYCRHVYVDGKGQLVGVIDWGDVHWGHPAVDLGCAFALFGPADREQFWSAYGECDEETILWARFRALYHSLAVRDYAEKIKNLALLRESRRAVERCLQKG